MLHTRYNSQTPLTGGAKLPIFDKRLYRLKLLGDDIKPCPPISEVASRLSFSNFLGAITSLKESVQVKQENQKMFYSLLFMFVLADEERDQLLLNSSPQVELNSLTLERYDQHGQLLKKKDQDDYQYLKPKMLHSAVKALSYVSRSKREISKFLAYYQSITWIEDFRKGPPQLTTHTYLEIRNQILKNSLRSAIQLQDNKYINFLAEFETPNLKITSEICSALFHQSCFDALWVFSRCNMLAQEGRSLSKRILSKFHEIERTHKSTRQAYDTILKEYPKCKQNLHHYLEALLRSRQCCEYLRRDYMENTAPQEVAAQKMASFNSMSKGSKPSSRSLATDTRNNLPRACSEVGLRAPSRRKSVKEASILEYSFVSQNQGEEFREEEHPNSEGKQRWNSSLFEVSMLGKFMHYLLSIDQVKECALEAHNSQIVKFLRHIHNCFKIEDESMLRILISMGYENEALYLIQAQHFRVSPEIYTTAIHCQAFIIALLLEGGSSYINQFDDVKKRLEEQGFQQSIKKEQERPQYLTHPTQGYYLKLHSIYNEFNEVMLFKLKTRPQYLQILLFIWKRRIQYIDYEIALSILLEIEAQLDYAITSQDSYGGYLRFVSNPLKICLLQIQFIEKLAQMHPQLLSKTTSLLKSLYDFSKRLQLMTGREEGMMEDSMRYILEDKDLEGRSVMRIITENQKLIDLVDHPTIEHKTVEIWEGPFRADRSLIPQNLRTVNSLLSSTRSSPVPLLFKCGCPRRSRTKAILNEHPLPSKKTSQFSLNSRRNSIQSDGTADSYHKQEFKFGLFSAADEARQYNKSDVSMYQYESWREGQILRYCQSYVFEFIIFLALHYFLLRAVATNRSLGKLMGLSQITPFYLQSYLTDLQIFDTYIHSIISICLLFWGIPLHYILVIIFKRLTNKKAKTNIANAIDFVIFMVVFLGTVFIFPSFYSLSSGLQTLKPHQINSVSLAFYYSEVKKYRDEADSPQLWSYLALVIALIWFQYVISLRVVLSIGSLFKVLIMNSKDFLIWLLMFLITLAMFSIAGFNLSVQQSTHTCRTFKLCLIMFFEASLGQISFAEQVHVTSAQVLLILCLIVNMVLLLTILIAMLNQSYNKIVQKDKLYQMTDLYAISIKHQLNNDYGAFLALDYPLSVFPGAFILVLLYCCNNRKPKDKLHKKRLESSNSAINDLLVRFISYTLFWIGVSSVVLILNILLIPFIYLCLITNECKLLCSSQEIRTTYLSSYFSDPLSPIIIEPQTAKSKRVKGCPRMSRFLKYSVWIVLLGGPLLLIQTILECVRFACSLCKSQKSLLK